MNPSCVACQNIATRVCIHPQCELVPFMCNNKCKNNVAQIMHTHNQQIRTILFQELDQHISNIDDTDKQKTLNKFNKRIEIIRLRLDQLSKQIELSKVSNTLIDRIMTSKHQGIKGKDICGLLNKKNIFEDQSKIEKNVIKIKKEYNDLLTGIENAISGQYQIRKKQEEPIKQAQKQQQLPEAKFYEYYQAGKQLIEKKDYLNALKQFLKAQQYNPFDPLNEVRIGICLGSLTKADEMKHYKNSIELGAQSNTLNLCYSNMSKCHLAAEQFKQALQCINKALEHDNSQSLFLIKGLIMMKLQSSFEALISFSQGIQLNPTRQLYSSRALCYLSLGMIQQAEQDQKKMLQFKSKIE